MESIDNILSFEVKKEIADRYFGFRKIIEEDTAEYHKKVLQTSHDLEQNVGHDLIRIYTLLDSAELIDRFLRITGLPDRLFVDSHINTQPKRKGIFVQQKFRGLTRKGCLQNMFFDAYSRLFIHVELYRQSFERLNEDQETICEQIQIFYRKNDIGSILHFLRSLDPGGGLYNAPSSSAMNGEMEEKMRIHPPPPVTDLLPELPKIPEVKNSRKELKELVRAACSQQPLLDLRRFK